MLLLVAFVANGGDVPVNGRQRVVCIGGVGVVMKQSMSGLTTSH